MRLAAIATCGEALAKDLLNMSASGRRNSMVNLDDIKITRRDTEVLKLLVEGCSNREIAEELHISPRTVKQHLRTLFLRAGIRDGRKRVKLATAMFLKEQACNPVSV